MNEKNEDQHLDLALHTFERLSLCSKQETDDNTQCTSFDQSTPHFRHSKHWRTFPYTLPRRFRHYSAPVRSRFKTDKRYKNALSTIRLHGCDFDRRLFPLFSYPVSKFKQKSTTNTVSTVDGSTANSTPSSGSHNTPCWKQYRQVNEYVSESQGAVMERSIQSAVSLATAKTVNDDVDNGSSSDGELNGYLDELSVYFNHFVNLRIKMSDQAKSMYV